MPAVVAGRMKIPELKRRVIREVRYAFSQADAPRYACGVDDIAETLFQLLQFEVEDNDYQAAGDQVLKGLEAYCEEHEVSSLVKGVEPFAALLLKLAAPAKYKALWESKQNSTALPGFAAVLKENGLGLAANRTLEHEPAELAGEPRFAEHVSRVYGARNQEVHRARGGLSEKEKAEIFGSACVFLVHAAAEYLRQIRSVMLVARHRC
jgi:hypothetical protein